MSTLLPRPYWYLRHGQTDWNRAGLSQGRTDVPLNETGIDQAVAAGKLLEVALRAAGENGVTRIVCSPLERALRTATIVRDALITHGLPALPLDVDTGLEEVCFGEQEGQPIGDWYNSWIAGEYTGGRNICCPAPARYRCRKPGHTGPRSAADCGTWGAVPCFARRYVSACQCAPAQRHSAKLGARGR